MMRVVISILLLSWVAGCHPRTERGTAKRNNHIDKDTTTYFDEDLKHVVGDSTTIVDYYYYALVYKMKGDTGEAINKLNKVLRAKPDYYEALLERGYLLNETKKYDLALLDFNNANKIKQNRFYVLFSIGYSNYMLRNFTEALSYFEASLLTDDACKDKSCAWCYYHKSLIEIEHLGDRKKGCEDFKMAVKHDSTIASLDKYGCLKR